MPGSCSNISWIDEWSDEMNVSVGECTVFKQQQQQQQTNAMKLAVLSFWKQWETIVIGFLEMSCLSAFSFPMRFPVWHVAVDKAVDEWQWDSASAEQKYLLWRDELLKDP